MGGCVGRYVGMWCVHGYGWVVGEGREGTNKFYTSLSIATCTRNCCHIVRQIYS